MRIVVLVDWEACRSRPGGKFETLKGTEQDFIASGLQGNNREVIVFPFGENVPSSIARLVKAQPKVVFNLTNSLGMDRRKAPIVATLLDLLGIPYTGSNAIAQMLCLDKAVSKLIVKHAGMETPNFIALERNCVAPRASMRFPLIVKPRFGESSELLSSRSIVRNQNQLAARLNQIFRRSDTPLICEEFIDGRDIAVCVLGNEKLQVLPPREFYRNNLTPHAPQFETHRVKHNSKYQAKWSMSYSLAHLSDRQMKDVVSISKRIYRALGIRDYARFDFRLTADNTFKFLEANSHPDLSPAPHSSFGLMSSYAGISYTSLLNRIVGMALKRFRAGSTQ